MRVRCDYWADLSGFMTSDAFMPRTPCGPEFGNGKNINWSSG